MIIAPNIIAKQELERHQLSKPIYLLDEYIELLLSQTKWQIATDSIIYYHLLKWVDASKISDTMQHLKHMLSENISTDELKSSSHPNSYELANIYNKLCDTLSQHNLIIKDAAISIIINEPELDKYHHDISFYGFCIKPKSINQLFQYLKASPYNLSSQNSIAYKHLCNTAKEEVQQSIKWHLNTPESAILLMQSAYQELFALYEYQYTGHMPVSGTQTLIVSAIKTLSAPVPKLALTVIPHLKQTGQYPQGFAITSLIPKVNYAQETTIGLSNHFSYIDAPQMQAEILLCANQFINILESILCFWRINITRTTPVGKCIQDCLNALYSLTYIEASLPYQQWHELFCILIDKVTIKRSNLKLFTPKDIQGGKFKHLWIVGAQNQNWFIQTKLSAIPQALQYKHPLTYLTLCADHITYSHPSVGENGEILHLPKFINSQDITESLSDEKSTLNTMDDWGVTHTPAEITGGISLIQDYATCPFKAFAKHRLKLSAKKPTSHEMPANHFGTIVHNVLESVYQSIKSQHDLASITPEQITHFINIAWKQAKTTNNIHPELRSILKEKMANTISDWLETDKERPFFTVQSLESQTKVSINDYKITLRIDRIDQQAGQPILIDYKTGRANIIDTFHPDFIYPQMALYSLSQTSIPTIAFAKVLHPETTWQSIDLACHQSLNKALNARGAEEETYEKLKAQWLEKALACLTNFEQGYYPATPINPQVCEQCDFKSLCRIYDQGVY